MIHADEGGLQPALIVSKAIAGEAKAFRCGFCLAWDGGVTLWLKYIL